MSSRLLLAESTLRPFNVFEVKLRRWLNSLRSWFNVLNLYFRALMVSSFPDCPELLLIFVIFNRFRFRYLRSLRSEGWRWDRLSEKGLAYTLWRRPWLIFDDLRLLYMGCLTCARITWLYSGSGASRHFLCGRQLSLRDVVTSMLQDLGSRDFCLPDRFCTRRVDIVLLIKLRANTFPVGNWLV